MKKTKVISLSLTIEADKSLTKRAKKLKTTKSKLASALILGTDAIN